MNKLPFLSRFVRFTALCFAALLATSTHAASRPPNIVFIIADDLGYGELGCYGQKKIRTPRLDGLASQGMRFTQSYSGNAVCAPSRCVLMTGRHPGHAWVRNNKEIEPEGQFPLPAGTITVARLLKEQGYATGAFGKWGLGPTDSEGAPLKQGFDRFYGYNCQRAAHNYYPQTLWDNDRVTTLDNPPLSSPQKLPANADPNSSESYKPYTGKQYSADVIAEQARRFVRENKDRPFFLFWPTTVPHLSLQVPEDSLKEYVGQFPEKPYTGDKGYLPQMYPHAAYAAMITRLDREVGRMVDLLDELKLAENTVVIFTSDNGGTHDKIGGSDSEFFASNAPLRGVKGQLYEGGFRVPLIVRWSGRVASGKSCERVTGFEDWMPTLAELAGAKRAVPMDGISFLPTLLGKAQPERPFLYREFSGYGGWQSLRLGDWKGVYTNLLRQKGKPNESLAAQPKFELFNLKSDPSEQHDVAAQKPELVEKMRTLMREQHTPSKAFPLGVVDSETTQAR